MSNIKKGNFHKIHPLFSLSIAMTLVGTVSLTIANDEEFMSPLSEEKDIVPISKTIDVVTEQQSIAEKVVSESAVQETIENILSAEIVDVLKSPKIAESYRVQPSMDFSVSDKRKLGGFRIIENGPALTQEQIKQFQTIVLDTNQYSLDQIKKCPFRPELGFLFEKDGKRVEFLLSMGCDKYLVVQDKVEKQGDYHNSARQPLLELRNALFPLKAN